MLKIHLPSWLAGRSRVEIWNACSVTPICFVVRNGNLCREGDAKRKRLDIAPRCGRAQRFTLRVRMDDSDEEATIRMWKPVRPRSDLPDRPLVCVRLFVWRKLSLYESSSGEGWTRAGDACFYGSKEGERVAFCNFSDYLIEFLTKSVSVRTEKSLPWASMRVSPDLHASPGTREKWIEVSKQAWKDTARQEEVWLQSISGAQSLPNALLPVSSTSSGLFSGQQLEKYEEQDFWTGPSLTFWLGNVGKIKSRHVSKWMLQLLSQALVEIGMSEEEFCKIPGTTEAATVVARATSLAGQDVDLADDGTVCLLSSDVDASDFQPSEHYGDGFDVPGSYKQKARASYLAAISLLTLPKSNSTLLESARYTLECMGIPVVAQGETKDRLPVFFAWTIPPARFASLVGASSVQHEGGLDCFVQLSEIDGPVVVYRAFTVAPRLLYGMSLGPIQIAFLNGSIGVNVDRPFLPGGNVDMQKYVSQETTCLSEEIIASFERPSYFFTSL